MRLVQKSLAKDDPEPKAVSCYGLYLPEIGDMWLRFVDGRPVSSITTRFLEWSLEKLEEMGKKVLLLLIWDSKPVGTSAKRSGDGSGGTTVRSK